MIQRAIHQFDLAASQVGDAIKSRWWIWPATLLGFALLTWTASLLVEPRPDEWTYLFGHQVGDTCAALQVTGLPCPSCGMTRSFGHAARLHLVRSFFYNPAGLALFSWITISGIVGAVRLITRDPDRFAPSHRAMMVWVIFWVVGLYTLPWVARCAWGINPLP